MSAIKFLVCCRFSQTFKKSFVQNLTNQRVTSICSLQDPGTWYRINYAGTQITQWDFQNKGKSDWTGKSSFVLEVPLRYLRPNITYSVHCDRIACKGPILSDQLHVQYTVRRVLELRN